MMTVALVSLSLLSGVAFGFLYMGMENMKHLEWLITGALGILVMAAGIDIGINWSVVVKLARIGIQVLMVPILVTVGSLVGAVLGGMFFSMNIWESLAIGGAISWYSLAGPVTTQIAGPELGTINFLTNWMREFMAFLFVPFIARYIGFLPTIGPGGATTMDSTLPIITKYTNPATSTIAFFNGFVTGALPPILIPFFLKMAGY